MSEQKTLSERIEEEYERYLENPEIGADEIYGLLFQYLSGIASGIINERTGGNRESVEDVVQDSLTYILGKGLTEFEKRTAKFATWCARIVKNRAIDWMRARNRHMLDFLDEDEMGEAQPVWDVSFYETPERRILELERRIMLCEGVKYYLNLLMNQEDKPYRTVSCCYTMVLFHRHNPKTKELSSPRWAYGNLEEKTVLLGAEDFLAEMYEWMPQLKLGWSEEFEMEMKFRENGKDTIGSYVFGEHFVVKDFENWSRRMREKVKKQMLEADINDWGLEL